MKPELVNVTRFDWDKHRVTHEFSLLGRLLRKKPHQLSRQPTPAEIDRIVDLRAHKDQETIKEILRPISFGVSDQVDWESNSTPSLASRIRNNLDFFWPFSPCEDALEGVRLTRKLGFRNTFCSGTPLNLAQKFEYGMTRDGFAASADTRFSAVLRPGTFHSDLWPGDHVNTAATKLLATVLFEIVDGQVPVTIEDDNIIAKWIANLLGGYVLVPLTEKQAESEQHLLMPEIWLERSTDKIIYNVNLADPTKPSSSVIFTPKAPQ